MIANPFHGSRFLRSAVTMAPLALIACAAPVADEAASSDSVADALALPHAVTYEGTTVVDGRTLSISWQIDVGDQVATGGLVRRINQFPSGAYCSETATVQVTTRLLVKDGSSVLIDDSRPSEALLARNDALHGACAGPTPTLTNFVIRRRAGRFAFGGRDVSVGAYSNIDLQSDGFTSLDADVTAPVSFDDRTGVASGFKWEEKQVIDIALFRAGDHGAFADRYQSTVLTRR